LADISATAGGAAIAAGAGPAATTAFATGTDALTGTLVSKTTLSGNFRSEWIRTVGKSDPEVKAPGSGTWGSTAFEISSKVNKAPPTYIKYRSKGILTPFPPRKCAHKAQMRRSNGGFLRGRFRFNAEAHIFATQGLVWRDGFQTGRFLLIRFAVTYEQFALLALILTNPTCIRVNVFRLFISIVSGITRVRSVK